MPKTKHTKTQQRNIVNSIFALVRKGHSVTEARKMIGNEVGVSPNTLFVWQHNFKMKTPTTTIKSVINQAKKVRLFSHNLTTVPVPEVIEIRSNVPLPDPQHMTLSKYGFISTLKVGQSFEVTTTTHDFKPSSLAPAAYQVASTIRNTTNKKFKVACRTLEGTSTHPTKVGCWRVA